MAGEFSHQYLKETIRDSSGGDIAMAAAPPPPPHLGAAEEPVGRENGGGNSNSGEIDERSSNRGDEGGGVGGGGGGLSGGSYGGNRWPRPETIALLRIRSEMDSVFRDSTPKAPLWEEVSRKLAELGYHRSAKKCKEKFENVSKYHKRTKDGRTAKHDGKTYRFFQELEAFEGKQQHLQSSAAPPPPPMMAASAVITPALPLAAAVPKNNTIPHPIMATVPSAHGNSTTNIATSTTTCINFTITPPSHLSPTPVTPAEPISSSQPLNPSPQSVFHPSYDHRHHNNHKAAAAADSHHLFSRSTSSSTASDEELDEAAAAGTITPARNNKRKRKWKDFFSKLTEGVIRKQEELQKKFLETVEKLDRERLIREDAWRVQETARINREHEVLIQERSTAAAKDAAVLAFLQKMSGGEGQQIPPPPPQPLPPMLPPQPSPAARRESSAAGAAAAAAASSSRWPKVEVDALIGLRTRLDEKYLENGPKGPLWEEISAEMKKIGYNRSAKRCKEKWENINKYFKKVKESNKRRPEDSKTCPYFHQLDALYREKSIGSTKAAGIVMSPAAGGGGYIAANPLRAVEPVAAGMDQTQPQQQQQWQAHPAPPAPKQRNAEEEEEDEEEDEEDYEDLETEDDEEGDGDGGGNGGGFQVVQNRPVAANER
ncbi:unnamed protein product [Linum tenue]|uniref:Myb-like domain-containing protein n=1 Tax=Linum tenue TaxID=586396 RepID=A0AAV0RXL2_9ROSI|nr:unnamed protein product [Linum tenue]